MRLRLLFSVFASVLMLFGLSAKELIIDGTYQGENIYIQNPFSNKENGFCIKEVYVNDKPFTEINSSAFEIILEGQEIGKYVKI